MPSRMSRTKNRRRNKKTKVGKGRKRRMRTKGTTPKFQVQI